MKTLILLIPVTVIVALLGGCDSVCEQSNFEAERPAIKKVIENSIGWAGTKDKELVFSCFADDEELFYFSPRDDGTIHGYKAFVELTENFFMRDDFRAIGFEVRDLHIEISRSGTVAWYHARLDDYNEFQGQPANWEDVRWTGVLEKREDRWVIVQMHFSFATDAKQDN